MLGKTYKQGKMPAPMAPAKRIQPMPMKTTPERERAMPAKRIQPMPMKTKPVSPKKPGPGRVRY